LAKGDRAPTIFRARLKTISSRSIAENVGVAVIGDDDRGDRNQMSKLKKLPRSSAGDRAWEH
jgi:hypothetical protein